ncbi:hypothetical protein DFH06DRAFT_1343941 [Mycena polygramma]|nr:hypothetical protein DFH06DRAFT_1351507 [Mycena polygramma]KAJ7615088.1 hypothetical protein DFH06DRAFT_1343941 [Mycena polygramma]
MGRMLNSVIFREEEARYVKAVQNPEGLDAIEFYAPTLDPTVASARRYFDPRVSRAIQELPTPTPTHVFPIFTGSIRPLSRPNTPIQFQPESPVIFATDPDQIAQADRRGRLIQIGPIHHPRQPLQPQGSTIPASLAHLLIQGSPAPDPAPSGTGQRTGTEENSRPLPSSIPGPPTAISAALPSVFPNLLGVPVIWADSVSAPRMPIPRFAVLGPAEPGFIMPDRLMRLTNADTNIVVVRRNHGIGELKPWCTVIEAEYEVEGTTRSRILLAANILVHPSFTPETHPNAIYVGGTPGRILFDRMDASPIPYNYGVSLWNYRQPRAEDSEDETDEFEDDETDELEDDPMEI